MRVEAYSQVSQLYQASKPKKVTKAAGNTAADQYQVSRSGRDYQTAKNAVNEAPDVREDKVKEYRERLNSGTYNVSSQEIAEYMVSKFFDSVG